jgi:hypothetical protein
MSSASEEDALNARKKDFSAFARLLRTFMRMEECAPFLERVDWEVLELWDYPDIVEVPMDLGTVKQKMGDSTGDVYKTVDEAADDVRQVWKNCLLYNAEGSDFYRLAQRLSAKFEDQFAEAYRDNSEPKREVDPDAVVRRAMCSFLCVLSCVSLVEQPPIPPSNRLLTPLPPSTHPHTHTHT